MGIAIYKKTTYVRSTLIPVEKKIVVVVKGSKNHEVQQPRVDEEKKTSYA